jgi:hypothetical protein
VPAALYLTPDDDANRLLAHNPLATLIGMLLDQQVPMEWASTSTSARYRSSTPASRMIRVAVRRSTPNSRASAFDDSPASYRATTSDRCESVNLVCF